MPVPGGVPANPQFFVDRVPGRWVVERGAVSHELVSSRFEPTGPARPQRAVALTFDDGPSPEYTPRILARLAKLHVPATFFVIGYLVAEYPSLVRREARMGMVVGNHSYNHPEVPPFDQLPLPLLRDEISLGDDALAALGLRTRLFRPPGGGTASRLVDTAAALDQRVVLWSVDPTDWEPGITAKEIARRVLANVRPGRDRRPARRGRRPVGHAGGATGDRARDPRARPQARRARARLRPGRGDERGGRVGRHYEGMDILAYVISGVISLAVVIVFFRVLFWAARKDGEKDVATQRKLGFRRKTRLGL